MELAIVLCVAGLILASLWGVIGIAHENVRQSKALQQITIVVNNIRALYQGRLNISGNYNGLAPGGLTDSLIQQKAIPIDMVRPGGACAAGGLCADTPWGRNNAGGALMGNGTFAVCDNTGGGAAPNSCSKHFPNKVADHQSFRIILRGLSKTSCIAMATQVVSTTGATGLVGVVITGSATNGYNNPPVPVLTARSKCDTTNNHVEYVFQLRQPNS
jgi:hypothetical protein